MGKLVYVQQPTAITTFSLGMITDIIISMDDKYVYFNNWLHGDIRQYDITNRRNPKLMGQVQNLKYKMRGNLIIRLQSPFREPRRTRLIFLTYSENSQSEKLMLKFLKGSTWFDLTFLVAFKCSIVVLSD